MEMVQDVINFWFKETESKQHFVKDLEFDKVVATRLEPYYQALLTKEITLDLFDPLALLAGCILLDQAPRNMYRDTPEAFASDARALELAKHAVAYGFDLALLANQRLFIYLPYEHAEDRHCQDAAVRLIRHSYGEDSDFYRYAVMHQDVIDRFGRFVHRNKILGRSSSVEERSYLAENGGF